MSKFMNPMQADDICICRLAQLSIHARQGVEIKGKGIMQTYICEY